MSESKTVEEAAKEYAIRNNPNSHNVWKGVEYDAFIAGAEWQKQQPIEEGDKVFVAEWISVEERLPELNQKVLVIQNPKTTATREPLYSVFNGEKFESIGFSHDGIHLGKATWADIIYWMPLPILNIESLLNK